MEGTRDDKQSDYVVGIKELEKKHGWKAKEVANEETMPHWLRVNWTKQGHEVSEESWYEMAIEYVHFLEREHPGLIEECTQVSAGAVLQALQDARELKPAGSSQQEVEVQPNSIEALGRTSVGGRPEDFPK